eukprot:Lithocolla_globosa_v1_NODE_2218_length_2105_cov_2.588780.p1 type:complete len:346 gc:universal NODE_2218_length_2105_cov_2.588780:896-1933(+)
MILKQTQLHYSREYQSYVLQVYNSGIVEYIGIDQPKDVGEFKMQNYHFKEEEMVKGNEGFYTFSCIPVGKELEPFKMTCFSMLDRFIWQELFCLYDSNECFFVEQVSKSFQGKEDDGDSHFKRLHSEVDRMFCWYTATAKLAMAPFILSSEKRHRERGSIDQVTITKELVWPKSFENTQTKKSSPALTGLLFLSHNWGKDSQLRDNHERVANLNSLLKARNVSTWFDEESMHGTVSKRMSEGIDQASFVLVFVTSEYQRKVNKPDLVNDNCKAEFHYAISKKPGRVLPVVMEEEMKSPEKWSGPLGFYLGQVLYVEASGEINDELVDKLIVQIVRLQQSHKQHPS